MLDFSSFSQILQEHFRSEAKETASEEDVQERMQRNDKQREKRRSKTQEIYTGSFHKPEVVLSPLHFQGEFTKCNI